MAGRRWSRPQWPSTPVDCFYLYPTVSQQTTMVADLAIDPEQISLARYQAARFSQVCDVFAPIYRQITLIGLNGDVTSRQREIVYASALSGWRNYLRNHNDGRGVVMIGHSQGAGLSVDMMAETMDNNPALRKRMVSGIIAGSSVAVPKGRWSAAISPTSAGVRRAARSAVPCPSPRSMTPPAADSISEDCATAPGPTSPGARGMRHCAPTLPRWVAAAVRCGRSTRASRCMAVLRCYGQTIMFSGDVPTAATRWVQPADRYSGSVADRQRGPGAELDPIGAAPVLVPVPTPQLGPAPDGPQPAAGQSDRGGTGADPPLRADRGGPVPPRQGVTSAGALSPRSRGDYGGVEAFGRPEGDPIMTQEQFDTMRDGRGFIAALDQSGGSTPKALRLYGIADDAYSGDEQMFDLIHQMRTRIITSPAFTGDRIVGSILFEQTMDRDIEGMGSAAYLWDVKHVVPFLKIDKGLADEADGVQVMKPIPGLEDLLARATDKGVFGTKMRSVIKVADPVGVAEVVDQQFEVARTVARRGNGADHRARGGHQQPEQGRSRATAANADSGVARCAARRRPGDAQTDAAGRGRLLCRCHPAILACFGWWRCPAGIPGRGPMHCCGRTTA